MTAVADTSPLIALSHLNLLHLLPALLGPTLVPPAVVAEATERRAAAPGAAAIRRAVEAGELQLAVPTETAVDSVPAWLGPGEREAIALAVASQVDWLVLDDRGARSHAARLGLSVIGTVRLLEVARDAGHVERVTPLLERLRDLGFRLSDEIIETIRVAEDRAQR